MTERVVTANGIRIWTEDFGREGDPSILLVMGASAQGIMWPDEFCEALATGGRHVIRYDNRDTGRSTCFDFAEQPYTLNDMAADAVGVLDAYGIGAAHVVGASMGGMIAQTVAINHPERVLTLTSIMSTPGGAAVARATQGEAVDDALPGPDPKVIEALAGQLTNPPTTREERIEASVRLWRALTGTASDFDEAAVRAREAVVLDRATNIDAAMNHGLAIAASPDRDDALASVTAPTLVIHGTADPILPFPHGEATAKAVPGAQLMPLDGVGHDLPTRLLPTIAAAIISHTA